MRLLYFPFPFIFPFSFLKLNNQLPRERSTFLRVSSVLTNPVKPAPQNSLVKVTSDHPRRNFHFNTLFVGLIFIVSYRIVSYRTVPYRIVSYRIVSYRIVLYCIALYCFFRLKYQDT